MLVTHGHPTMVRNKHLGIGRLVQPRHFSSIEQTAREGFVWAADNDCFQGLDEDAWIAMMDRLEGLPGCRFCVVPDVVADHVATDLRWRMYALEAQVRGLPPAYVLQDGCVGIPADAEAVFIGGSTGYKLGPDAARLVVEAKERGLWVHMGRVNTARRIGYAASIGCDSIDGSQWARWEKVHLRRGLNLAAAPPQMRMENL